MRPPFYWNFFEEKAADKIKDPNAELSEEEKRKQEQLAEEKNADGSHILRTEVLDPRTSPKRCYRDGRVDHIMEALNQLGDALKTHDKERWETLVSYCVNIFKHLDKQS